jgi:hypothetical protein
MLAGDGIGTILSVTLYSARAKSNARRVPAWTTYTLRRQQPGRAGRRSRRSRSRPHPVPARAYPTARRPDRYAQRQARRGRDRRNDPRHTAADHLLAQPHWPAELSSRSIFTTLKRPYLAPAWRSWARPETLTAGVAHAAPRRSRVQAGHGEASPVAQLDEQAWV